MKSNPYRALLVRFVAPYWQQVTMLAGLLLAGITLELVTPQIVGRFIDQAEAGEPFEHLIWIALIFIGVTLLAQVSTVAESYVAENLGWRTTNALRAELSAHVLGLDASFHAEHGVGELIERIDGDVSAIANFFARFVVEMLGSALFLIGVLVLLTYENWRIGALLTFFALVALIFLMRGGGFVGARSRVARRAAADVTGYVEERLAGLPDLKTSGADTDALHRLLKLMSNRFHRDRAAVMAGSAFNGVVGLLFVLATAAALVLSTTLYRSGAITLGTIYLVFRYTGMLRQPIDRLSRQMNSFQQATGGIVRVNELLATRPAVVDGPGATFPPGGLAVDFEDVSFAYETEPVLRDVSFHIEPGAVLGLLGRTGSGKTTISRLLFRLHDPGEGMVRVGGVNIRDARLDELRGRVGLVTQDVQLFQGTLRDNVSLFDQAVPDTRLHEVFAELGLDTWLHSLPDGLNTPLGAGGRGLSAGEAQLVALARVFLKNPGLVVLDEASSRLDPATERLLEHAVTRLLAGRTGIIIAHRLNTIERADQILILEDGRIVELGRRVDLANNSASRFTQLLRAGMTEALV